MGTVKVRDLVRMIESDGDTFEQRVVTGTSSTPPSRTWSLFQGTVVTTSQLEL